MFDDFFFEIFSNFQILNFQNFQNFRKFQVRKNLCTHPEARNLAAAGIRVVTWNVPNRFSSLRGSRGFSFFWFWIGAALFSSYKLSALHHAIFHSRSEWKPTKGRDKGWWCQTNLHTPFMWTVYCQCAVELTRAAAISVIYRMVGGGDFFRPVTVMWRFCTNN